MKVSRFSQIMILALATLGASTVAWGAPLESKFTYQGRLYSSGNPPVPVAQATLNVSFKVWDQEAGGTVFAHGVANNVAVVDGLFSFPVKLKEGDSGSDDYKYQENKKGWFQVTVEIVGGATGLEFDRQEITLAPFSGLSLVSMGLSPETGKLFLKGSAGGFPTESVSQDAPVFLWYPAKSAFRAGTGGGTFWADQFIGDKSVGIGYRSRASGFASVALGYGIAEENYAAAVGGYSTKAIGDFAFAAGGASNLAIGESSTVVGGRNNTSSEPFATVVGGENNNNDGSYSATVGGYGNYVTGVYSGIFSGRGNTVYGDYSLGMGRGMFLSTQADRTFAFGYATSYFPIDAPNAFLIFPTGEQGSVGINISDPQEALHMDGAIRLEEQPNSPTPAIGAGYIVAEDVGGDTRLLAYDDVANGSIISSHTDPSAFVNNSITTSFEDSGIVLPWSFHHFNRVVGKGTVVDMARLVQWAEGKMIAELGAMEGTVLHNYDLPTEKVIDLEYAEASRLYHSATRRLERLPWIEVPLSTGDQIPDDAWEEIPETLSVLEERVLVEKAIDWETLRVIETSRTVRESVERETGRNIRRLRNGYHFIDGVLYRKPTLDDIELMSIEGFKLPEWIRTRTASSPAGTSSVPDTESSRRELVNIYLDRLQNPAMPGQETAATETSAPETAYAGNP